MARTKVDATKGPKRDPKASEEATPKTKEPTLRTLPSKKGSCSELARGHKQLMEVKTEQVDPSDYQKKIQD